MIYDVIIAGAGVSGTVLAYLLAEKGVSTLILEKTALPRYKACGGGVTIKAVSALPFDIDEVVVCKPIGGELCYRGRRYIKRLIPEVAWLVEREDFDLYLAKQAVKAGAKLLEKTGVVSLEESREHVVVRTSHESYEGRFLVGADGVTSVVSRAVGLLQNRCMGMAVAGEVGVDETAYQQQGAYATFDFGAIPRGYAWIFPKRKHLTIGFFQSTAGKAPEARKTLEEIITRFPHLKNYRLIRARGHHIPLGGKPQRLHKGRVLLVGDAANLADAWLGEGIYYAIQSARIAAQELMQNLHSGSADLENYTARVNAEIVEELRRAGIFASIVYRYPYLGTALMSRSLLMQEYVFGVMRGDYTFRQFNRLLLRGLPQILLQQLGR